MKIADDANDNDQRLRANDRRPISMPKRTDIVKILIVLSGLVLLAQASATDGVEIRLSHNSSRERQEKMELEQLVKKYDLSRYTFTHEVIIEERSMNHSFPVLTLNVYFLGSDDELLSSFLHEQLHWWLRDHPNQMQEAVRQLREWYPRAPVGLPEGADTEYSTYGHLVDCYLEIQADRQLIGEERTSEVIKRKPWYLWIYKTVLQDEDRIGELVKKEQLEVR